MLHHEFVNVKKEQTPRHPLRPYLSRRSYNKLVLARKPPATPLLYRSAHESLRVFFRTTLGKPEGVIGSVAIQVSERSETPVSRFRL